MRGQKKKHSLLEIFFSTFIGYIVAVITQLFAFPLFGIHITNGQHLLFGLIFTIVSLIRGYFVRRLFNMLHVRKIL